MAEFLERCAVPFDRDRADKALDMMARGYTMTDIVASGHLENESVLFMWAEMNATFRGELDVAMRIASHVYMQKALRISENTRRKETKLGALKVATYKMMAQYYNKSFYGTLEQPTLNNAPVLTIEEIRERKKILLERAVELVKSRSGNLDRPIKEIIPRRIITLENDG